jgi:hypothetical protein
VVCKPSFVSASRLMQQLHRYYHEFTYSLLLHMLLLPLRLLLLPPPLTQPAQLHNCRGLNAEIPAQPDPAPMTQWRGTTLTHETAEDLFIGWLSNGPQIPDGGPGLKPYSWLVAAGKNPVSEGCWGGAPICHPAAKLPDSYPVLLVVGP